MDVTIVVKYCQLAMAVQKIHVISNAISSRSLNITMDSSKGEFAEAVIDLAGELNQVGHILADLTSKTEKILQQTQKEFVQAENLSIQLFGK